jgi:hypothetical protein
VRWRDGRSVNLVISNFVAFMCGEVFRSPLH